MSEWTARISGNPIWERLPSARAQLDQITLTAEDQPEAGEDLIRLRTVLHAVESRLKAADPLLLHPGSLSSIDTHLQQLLAEIASFQANRNRGHLVNANSQADSVLVYVAQLALPTPSSAPEAQAAAAVKAQERKLRDKLDVLQEAVEATTQEVS